LSISYSTHLYHVRAIRTARRYLYMQPEDMSGGVPGIETDAEVGNVPDSWVEKRVEAVIVRPVNPDQPGYSTSLTALTYTGVLEAVGDRGIMASLSSETEVLSPSTFYPWGAILSIRLAQEQQ
jgi:hypothetical protein